MQFIMIGVEGQRYSLKFSYPADPQSILIVTKETCFSQGTAEVVFSRWSEALAAVKRYDNVQLDGKPMKIDIVGPNIMAHSVLPSATNGMYVNRYGAARRLVLYYSTFVMFFVLLLTFNFMFSLIYVNCFFLFGNFN